MQNNLARNTIRYHMQNYVVPKITYYRIMKAIILSIICFMPVVLSWLLCACSSSTGEQAEFPAVSQLAKAGDFPLFDQNQLTTICLSEKDYPVVGITARMLADDASQIEVRTLPTLHIYEGRDARYAVQLDDAPAEVFSIHEGDFTSEWRCNVLRGYATRSIYLNNVSAGLHTLRVYLLDPGIALQEILVK